MPALIVVVPVYVLAPVKVQVPASDFMRLAAFPPLPFSEMTPETVPEPDPPKVQLPFLLICTPLAMLKACELLFAQVGVVVVPPPKEIVPKDEPKVVVPLIVLLIVTLPVIVRAGEDVPANVTVPSSNVMVFAVTVPETVTV